MTDEGTELKVELDEEARPISGSDAAIDGTLEWNDVNVTITINECKPKAGCKRTSNSRQILNNVSGKLEKGQLLGIMGGSGGKTTLLNALCGRLLNGGDKEVSGDIAYKGEKRVIGKNDSIKYISAYVMQSDILCPTQTVKEAFLFSAKLRLPSDMPVFEKQAKVDQLITNLKLNKCQNTLVGNDAIRGVSGGEKKRVSVGVELITDPNLLFLDEPTSGLDSYVALETLKILKRLTSEQGKQAIATIHQPSSDIFNMLDELCLLANGYCVYFGPRKDVLSYFEKLGYKCPEYTNPADFVVNQIQINPNIFIDAWKENEKDFLNLNFDNYPKLKPKSERTSSFFYQSALIFQREWNILFRDPRPSLIRLIQTFVFAGLVAILYWQLPDTQEGIRDRFGAAFFITINSSMAGLMATIIVFPEQRLLFEKERNANMYGTTTYVLSKSLVQLPEQLFFSVLYVLIVYWTVGLESSFIEVYLVLTLCILTSGSMGMIVGCFANNTSEAMQLMPASFIPLLLFTNFMVSLEQIPVWIRWLQWIDVFKYVIEAISITEFSGEGPYELSENANGQLSGYEYGDDYLSFLDYNSDNLHFDWYMTAVLFIGFRLLTWVILVRRNGW